MAVILLMPWYLSTALAEPTPQELATTTDGARIFAQRCVLCHGNYGAGDGFMPLVIVDYPETSLLTPQESGHFSELQSKVMWGGAKGEMNEKSPPWTDELNLLELKAITQFVISLRENPEQSWKRLDSYLAKEPVSLETGRLVYKTRCENCHGLAGRGDGPMSAIVKTPPPSNLTQTQLSKLDLNLIISLGGSGVGRSAQMPAWKGELTKTQIESVGAYIQQFRN